MKEALEGQQWRSISCSRTLANLGKKTPYIAPQKTNRYRYFGHPGAARSSPEQPGAEPRVAPACTPERLPGHCLARSSPEQLRISLRICKTAKPLIRKTRYLLHPKSVFSKLGLFEKLIKSNTTLCRETPRNVKRKNTKFREV
jgi:hypothetical protein